MIWWLWWPMISRDGWSQRFPDMFYSSGKKPEKNLNQENWSKRGSNPSSLGETTTLLLDHSSGVTLWWYYYYYHYYHSPSFSSLHLRHNSFSKPSVALPTSQLILQPFRCFTYVTAHSPTVLSVLLRLRLFTYVAWRAAHALNIAVPCVLSTSRPHIKKTNYIKQFL